ncbi:MAG: hypothetical protein CMJ60_02710, partial [Planctomycetaceae bacterium]|nr:hypothetical protein [Planctomycetaceae bacterium]
YFRQTKDRFIAELESLGTLDGVLLIMHGAIFVDDLDDPEGEWIEAVREVAGHITPVPGGVGPLTVTMLMYNTLDAAKLFAGM